MLFEDVLQLAPITWRQTITYNTTSFQFWLLNMGFLEQGPCAYVSKTLVPFKRDLLPRTLLLQE